MGRHPQLAEEVFRKAYYKCGGSVVAIADELSVTRMTVYNYCRRYEVKPKTLKPALRSMDLYNDYVGHQSIRTLGRKYKLNSLTVRDRLLKAVKEIWSGDNPPTFPKPTRVFEIKIIKALIENGNMPIGKTIPIAMLGRALSIHQRYVEEYMARIHAKAQAASNGDEGLRSKSKHSSRVVHSDGNG